MSKETDNLQKRMGALEKRFDEATHKLVQEAWKDCALQELALLEAIIARQDQTRLRVKGWAFTAATAMVVVFLTGKPFELGVCPFLALTFSTCVLSVILDTYYGGAEELAINRSTEVESILRRMSGYDGPKIGVAMRGGEHKADLWEARRMALKRGRTWLPYAVLLVQALVAVYVLAPVETSLRNDTEFGAHHCLFANEMRCATTLPVQP